METFTAAISFLSVEWGLHAKKEPANATMVTPEKKTVRRFHELFV